MLIRFIHNNAEINLTFVYQHVPQIASGLGFDMASLINNPAFISMVRARALTY